MIFYVVFFAPVMLPVEQLPWVLRQVSVVMPPTYAADAIRGSLTNLPDTHILRSMAVLGGFALASLAFSAGVIRKRG